MTCICGHHEKAHLSGLGLCAAPEGCNCNRFVKAKPESPAPKRFADMTDAELWQWGEEVLNDVKEYIRAYPRRHPMAATPQPSEPLADRLVAAVQELPHLGITGNAGKLSGIYVNRTGVLLTIRRLLALAQEGK